MPPKPIKGVPTQEHLPFSAVYQDTLILKNGEFRQIIMVSSINFGLKSEEEQNAILYSYQSFLNSLPFPIQILIRSRQIDLAEYLNNLKKHMFQQPNELIRYQTQEYVDFISRLISIANIMDKKFLIVVPYAKPNVKTGIFTPKHPALQVSLKDFEDVKMEMRKRIEVVQQGLASLGLQSVVLTTEQVIELLYASYNITESMREKLQNTGELAQTAIEQRVEGQKPEKGSGPGDLGLGQAEQTGTHIPVQGEGQGNGSGSGVSALGGATQTQEPNTQPQTPNFISGTGNQFNPAPTNLNRQVPPSPASSNQSPAPQGPINIPIKQ